MYYWKRELSKRHLQSQHNTKSGNIKDKATADVISNGGVVFKDFKFKTLEFRRRVNKGPAYHKK